MILTLNIGTSSIKAGLYVKEQENIKEVSKTDQTGYIELESALQQVIQNLIQSTSVDISSIKAIGIRIVHGGSKYISPSLVTEDMIEYLHSIIPLAPLHNPPALEAITIVKNMFSSIPIIGVFDTAFHRTMPEKASHYAIPKDFEEKYHIQRYGFHGLAHKSMLDLYCKETNASHDKATILTVQLGSGCSMCAIKQGQSIDTSMGFSPLEGLISRTRSGDIDAAVIPYLSKHMNISADQVIEMFNKQSGLQGVGGEHGDMRELLPKVQQEDAQAMQAVELFIYRIQKYLGAYEAIVEGSDAIIVGGGISEHCPDILTGIFKNPYFGVSLVEFTSESLHKPIHRITTDSSNKHVYIAFVDEEKEIAKGVIDVTQEIMKE